MFKLDATQSLARMGLNALTVSAIERDALVAASLMLERHAPGDRPSEASLIREANQILPSPSNNAECFRMFWSTKRQTEDGGINNLSDLGLFISMRAAALEEASVTMLKESKSPQLWIQALARLAEAYSYVIEAALALESMGMIPLRRRGELERLTTMPDPDVDYSGSLLFMKALALHGARLDEDKHTLKEQYR